MITKEAAIEKFQEILNTKSDWAVFKDSQFAEHLAVFISWSLRQALFSVERTHQEFWLSTSINRSSVLAHAEDREYIPRRPTPSTGTIDITNNGETQLTIPMQQHFTADSGRYYSTTEPVVIDPGETKTVPVWQAQKEVTEFTIDEEKAFYEWLFDASLTAQIHSFEVYLDTGGGLEEWKKQAGFQNVYATSKVYDEAFSHTDQIVIRFGNGIFGMIPPVSTSVRVVAWLTDGVTALIAGQPLSIISDSVNNSWAGNVQAVVKTAIAGGQATEDTEELRRNLHYWPVYNERLVWKNDYTFFLKRLFPNITWINAWGEEEAEALYGPDLEFINKVFISAYSTDMTDFELGTAAIAALEAVPLYNREFEWVAPQKTAFRVTLSGKIQRKYVLADVNQAIKEALEALYGKDSFTRNEEVFLKDIYDTITGTGFFGDSESWFEVATVGTTAPTVLHEMIYIDLDNSAWGLEYL